MPMAAAAADAAVKSCCKKGNSTASSKWKNGEAATIVAICKIKLINGTVTSYNV